MLCMILVYIDIYFYVCMFYIVPHNERLNYLKHIYPYQVLGPKMIKMIDRALYYKEKYNEFNVKLPSQVNPYNAFKMQKNIVDGEKYAFGSQTYLTF